MPTRDDTDANARHVEMLARTRGAGAYVINNDNMRWTASEAVGKALALIIDSAGMFRTCVNCDHWQDDKQLCRQFNALPPAKVIVVGCEKHTDLIPF